MVNRRGIKRRAVSQGGRRGRPRDASRDSLPIDHALAQARNFSRLDIVRFPGTGYPDQLRCVLKYNQSYNTSGSVSPASQVFRANSLFDPDLTGTGHQPNSFDQIAAIYGTYCVTASRATVQIVNQQSATGLKVAAVYSDQNVGSYTVENLCELKYAKSVTVSETTSGPNVVNINFPTMSMSTLQGQRDLRDDPNNYTLVTTNPVDPTFFIIRVTSTDAVTTSAMGVNVTLWFDCTFKELVPPGESLLARVLKNKYAFEHRHDLSVDEDEDSSSME